MVMPTQIHMRRSLVLINAASAIWADGPKDREMQGRSHSGNADCRGDIHKADAPHQRQADHGCDFYDDANPYEEFSGAHRLVTPGSLLIS
jgi:hypothetical protein